MPALYNMTITTKGLNLRARADAEALAIEFTKVAIGSGVYDGSEDLASMEDLKTKEQELGINSKTYADNTVSLKTVVTNTDVEEGYYIKEIGVYAKDPDEPEGAEILYSISLAMDDKWDFLPAADWGPASIQLSIDTAISNAEQVEIAPGSGAYALAEDVEELKNPEFEDYEEGTAVPDVETSISQIQSGKSLQTILQYVKASIKGLYTLAKTAYNIALGRNQARVFATVDALDTWLSDPENVAQLHTGDNLYIVATNVPDYWWDGEQKQPLETQKVDMTTYDTALSEINEDISNLQGQMASFESTKSEIVSSGLGQAVGLTTSSTWAQLVEKIKSIVNHGAVNQELSAGGSYTILQGYHSGGKVTAKSLASQTDATATAAQILSGYTAWVKGNKITGAMTNQGAVSQTLNCGGSYTIPAGYHNGSGKVGANSLASQTDATAAAAQILSGYTAWVKGSKITGTMANKGNLNWSGSNTTYSVPAGYYSGGTLDSRPSYNAGVAAGKVTGWSSKTVTVTSSGSDLAVTRYNGKQDSTRSSTSPYVQFNTGVSKVMAIRVLIENAVITWHAGMPSRAIHFDGNQSSTGGYEMGDIGSGNWWVNSTNARLPLSATGQSGYRNKSAKITIWYL